MKTSETEKHSFSLLPEGECLSPLSKSEMCQKRVSSLKLDEKQKQRFYNGSILMDLNMEIGKFMTENPLKILI